MGPSFFAVHVSFFNSGQADALNEGMKLMREIDKFRLDSERLQRAVEDFRTVLQSLFGPHGAVWSPEKSSGLLTSYMYKFLEQPRALDVCGDTRILGGSKLEKTSEVMTWVRQEMGSWLAACLASVDAEFPFWETAQAFQIFDLRPRHVKHVKWSQAVACMERLCKRFGLPKDEAVEEYRVSAATSLFCVVQLKVEFTNLFMP